MGLTCTPVRAPQYLPWASLAEPWGLVALDPLIMCSWRSRQWKARSLGTHRTLAPCATPEAFLWPFDAFSRAAVRDHYTLAAAARLN